MNFLEYKGEPKETDTSTAVTPLYAKYLAYLDVSKSTAESYAKTLKQLFMYFERHGITHPERDDILAYREELQTRGLKATTIQNYIVVARIFFKWAAQEGFYHDIAQRVKSPKISNKHKRDYLTSAQARDLLESIARDSLQGLRDYAMLALMVAGGLRTIEVCRADIQDIQKHGGQSVLYVQGKGKTEKADYVKLPAVVEKAIRDYIAARGLPAEGPLFASISNKTTGRRLATRSISHVVKERLKAAGFSSPRLTAHSLRHTAVTLALLGGEELTRVREFARHESINTTMVYNHALDLASNGCSGTIAGAVFE